MTKNSKRQKLSRSAQTAILGDLAERLSALQGEAKAFATVIKPNSQHSVIEWETRTGCAILLANLRRQIGDAEALCRLIAPN